MGSHHSLFSTRNHLDPSLVRLYGRSAFPPSLNFSFLLIPLGHCLVTLGTGPRPHLHWRTTPLLTAHSYPVIGLSLPLTPPSILTVSDIKQGDHDERLLTLLDTTLHDQSTRTLHIPWSDALYLFDGIYLSWDPALWSHRLDFHGQVSSLFSLSLSLSLPPN